ncbi:LysR family transcriptional regulator [Kaustia mangrovi]|uniref:LysR family transcriptional regulator n=1 Tax=Kaustia mangrovi TaxID=2593653 RepID=A0A7S8C7M8_9HYPH|nr:LysR substrate-binding domain-containing protein [Kaustia mangrovi]QPC44867.1 LysR family transcriptional regulator [Kaustia mangrovi]
MSRALPPLRLLTVFEAVLRHGGVRPASAELNVSQPAVSQALRQLEAHLGATLLDRSTRPAGLTEAGRLLHRATAEGLGLIAEAIEDIERLNAGVGPSATVACSVGFATYWLMPRLAGFYDRNPDMAINVMTTQQGAPGLTAGVDIAIRYGDGKWNDGVVTHLFDERIDPVCSPALAARLAEAGGGLEAATLIHVNVEDGRWTPWGAYLRRAGLPAAGRRQGLHFTNYVQATQAALAGQGVMLGWRSITGDLVREGRLDYAMDATVVPEDAFYLVAADRPRSPAAVAAATAWLAGEAARPEA